MGDQIKPLSQDQNVSFVDEMEGLLPEMRAFARSLCRDATLADDLVQDACIKAWAAKDSFDASKSMRPWLFRILRNEYYQQTRRSWRNVDSEAEFFETALISPCNLESLSDMARMEAAIYSLPSHQRDALILVVAAGFTYDEVGKILECSPGTIKSRVSRAREMVVSEFGKTSRPTRKPQTASMERLLHDIDRLTAYAKAA